MLHNNPDAHNQVRPCVGGSFFPTRSYNVADVRITRTFRWSAFRSGLLLEVAIASSCAAAVLYMGGCQTDGTPAVSKIQQSLDDSRIQLAKLRADNETALAEAKVKGDTKAQEKAEKSLEVIAKSEETANAAAAAIGAANGDQQASEQLTKYTDKLPFPFNLVAGIGIPLAIAGVQELRVRRANGAAASIVSGIDEVRKASPAVVDAMDANKVAIEQKFTPLAKKIVKKHKAKKGAA